MKILWTVVFSTLLVACRTLSPEEIRARQEEYFARADRRVDPKLQKSLRVGMTDAEVQNWYGGKPLASQVRPDSVWPTDSRGPEDVFAYVILYQKLHSVEVWRCDVYWRGSGIFSTLWADYIFFDEKDKLIGYHSRWLD
jgi:hypothetical protein